MFDGCERRTLHVKLKWSKAVLHWSPHPYIRLGQSTHVSSSLPRDYDYSATQSRLDGIVGIKISI